MEGDCMSQTLEDFAEQKNMKPGELLTKYLGAEQKDMMRPATHVGKYTHPGVAENLVIAAPEFKVGVGYICFGNFVSKLKDYVGNAAKMPHAKTMEAIMQDGRTVREHLFEISHELKQNVPDVDEEEIKKWNENFYDLEQQSKVCSFSDFKLKQIYFPLDGGKYQLLTLLPCPPLIWELKSRINSREWETREENGKEYNVRISFIDQWVKKYGGEQPQNISFLNNLNRRTSARVLTCLPPTLRQNYQLPRRNFFNQIKIFLPRSPDEAQRGIGQLFQSLYDTLHNDPNTLWVRRKKRGILRAIIERGIIMSAEKIRENAMPGWSKQEKYSSLPAAQKAWLDPLGGMEPDQGQDQEDWQEEIAQQISRFIRSHFEKMVRFDQQKSHIVFDEAFSKEVSALAKEYLDG
jgi:CRISPR-associated protein Csy1